MADLRFTKEHEWICVEGTVATMGITAYAQDQLGDIVFVDLPETGKALTAGDEALALESTKAAASIYSPVTGVVGEVNDELEEAPEQVNSDPQGAGWMIQIELETLAELDALMDQAAYDAYLQTLE